MPFDSFSFLAGAVLGAAAVFFGLRRAGGATDARLREVERALALQFENLANRIFEEKTNAFSRQSQEGLSQMLSPLRERLQEFQKRVEDSFGAHAREQYSLKKEIENIVAANHRVTEQADRLARALKGDVKAQGNWGEVMLEKILEDSGLRKETDYVLQGAGLGLKHAEDGSHLKPDVVVFLPEGKHVVIDAKVSLTAYERYCAAEDEAQKAPHLRDFLSSVRGHVGDLEKRRYQDTDKLGTPDFVLMFMPIEGAYALAMQKDGDLHAHAWGKKVVIVCPSTLFVTLKTVASVWRMEQQNKNAEEIARQGGGLYDKVAGFVEDMQALGLKLDGAQKTFGEAMKKLSDGKGSLLRRAESLRELGVKTSKRLAGRLADDAGDDAA